MSKLNEKLYRKMYLIRKVEKVIQRHYGEDEMRTPMHMSMGSEAIAAGVCCALREGDQVLATHRTHSTYLAKTEDTDNFFLEIYGKGTSIQQGKAGSMHLCNPDLGYLGVSAIVGSIIPVAVGIAFANKVKKNGKVVAVFFGDGALDEGVFWESLNIACLKELSIIFVCEDNDLAVHTPRRLRQGYKSIDQIVSKYRCRTWKYFGTDVGVIHKETTWFRKDNSTPVFFHFRYFRYLEHCGVYEDFDAGYRSAEEVEEWYDPVRYRELKLNQKIIRKIQAEIDTKVEKSLEIAKLAPYPTEDELLKGVLR